MKHFLFFILFSQLTMFGSAQSNNSDSSQTKTFKVAIFAPIFLDSAFNGTFFKISGNNSLPKTILPGLDFYNGVMMAIDSLQREKMPLEILFFDTKSKDLPMKKILTNNVWDSVSLIIASFKDRHEIKPMADFAKLKKIPIISATYPNDGGVNDNPYFVLLNSTLRTHCEGVYKYIQKNFSTNNLIYIKRHGRVENEIEKIFREIGEITPAIPLKYKTVILTDSLNQQDLRKVLDSSKTNVIICGSVNENFGIRLVKTLGTLKGTKSIAIGMPTWDGIKEFNNLSMDEATKGVEIVYSSPYYFPRKEAFGKYITEQYKDKFFARASDWFLKGYETTYNFCHLLVKYQQDFMQQLTSTEYKVFTDYNIQPLLNKNEVPSIDYFENKNLYFYRKQDGILKSVH